MFSLFFKHNRKQAIAATINIPTRKKNQKPKTKEQKHKNEIQNKKQKKNKIKNSQTKQNETKSSLKYN